MSRFVRSIAAHAALLAAVASAAPLAASAQGRAGALAASAGQDSGVAFERQLARVVQRQLALSDDQLVRLQAVDARFRQRRLANQRSEVQARRAIRRALAAGGDAASTAPIDTLIDRFIKVQGERVELQAAEQSELRQFLTPVQRAKYLGIQEFVRRRANEMRSARDSGVAPAFRRRLRRP